MAATAAVATVMAVDVAALTTTSVLFSCFTSSEIAVLTSYCTRVPQTPIPETHEASRVFPWGELDCRGYGRGSYGRGGKGAPAGLGIFFT